VAVPPISEHNSQLANGLPTGDWDFADLGDPEEILELRLRHGVHLLIKAPSGKTALGMVVRTEVGAMDHLPLCSGSLSP